MIVEHSPSIANRLPRPLLKPLFILLLALSGFAVMGYHPGLEDDGIYLAAVKADLNPALYPHDVDFVRLQAQATIFDELMAGLVRATHLPVGWTELLAQFLSLTIILWAGHGIAQMLFAEQRAQWAATALLSAMFTLPVAGTALYIADQHLHPRTMATALVLVAVERVMAGKRWQAAGMLLIAALMHPIMAAFGVSFCVFLFPGLEEKVSSRFASKRAAIMFAALPMRWVLEPPTPEWRRALDTRSYYFLYRWTWYEWLGAIGPLVLFWALWRWIASGRPSGVKALIDPVPVEAGLKRLLRKPRSREKHPSAAKAGLIEFESTYGLKPVPFKHSVCQQGVKPRPFRTATPFAGRRSPLERFALAVFMYGVFQQAVAMVLLAWPGLIRLTPFQPMRYLHLEYVFLVLIAGGLLGRHALGCAPWRWALFLALANGGMFCTQRMLLPASEHLELPGRASRNPWLQAFAWIRENTPADAWFALDPEYLAAPGEDYHSFRALAERSQLADAMKDAAVVTQVPELGPRWAEQQDAQAGWNRFQSADFERLKARFGVGWVLLSYPAPDRLTCIWHNDRLAVCRIPGKSPP